MARTSRQLVKGSATRVLLFFTSIIIGFLMMPFLVHSLGDEQYGIWALVVSIAGFYNLMDAGMSDSLQRYLIQAIHGEEPDEVNTALSTSIILSTVIGALTLLATLSIAVAAPVFVESAHNQHLFRLTLWIVGTKAALQLPLYPYYGILVARYRYDITSYLHLCSLLVRSSLTVFYIIHGYGIIAIAVISAVTDICVSIIIIGYARRYAPQVKVSLACFRFDKLKEYYHYGKFLYVIELASKIQNSLDDIVVSTIIGIAAVTHYTIAVTLILYFKGFIDAIFGVISPLLNRYYKLGQWNNLRDVFLVTTEITTSAAILIGGMLILLGRQFISLWVGEDYTNIYPALVLLSVSAIFSRSQAPGIFTLLAIAKHRYFAKITSIEAVANLGLSIVLAHYLGIFGVALGTAIPSLVNSLYLQPRYTCQQLDIPLIEHYKILSKSLLTGLMVFIPAFFAIQKIRIDNFLVLVIVGLIIGSIYLLVLSRYMISKNTIVYVLDSLPDRVATVARLLVR